MLGFGPGSLLLRILLMHFFILLVVVDLHYRLFPKLATRCVLSTPSEPVKEIS